MTVMNSFDSGKFDHAVYGVKILFDDELIKRFTKDEKDYPIIKKAILNHSRLFIEDGLDDRELLHSKIIRDSDKLDNFSIKLKRRPDHLFKNIVKSKEEFENSKISDEVYSSIISLNCVKLKDRKYPLDYFLCVLAFVFDLNFNESYKLVKNEDYINKLIDRFDYSLSETKQKIETVRKVINDYINNKIEV